MQMNNVSQQLSTLLQTRLEWTLAGAFFAALLISMAMGFVLSRIYTLYYRSGEPIDYGLGHSFLLMMPAVTSIFILIQYSLPLSLGLLGALSFVRFRTPIKRPEDIAFILLSISISLSCAVQYYHVATFLLLIVGLYAFARTRLPAFSLFSSGYTLVTVRDTQVIPFADITTALAEPFGAPVIINTQKSDGFHSVVFAIKAQTGDRHAELASRVTGCVSNEASIDIVYSGGDITA